MYISRNRIILYVRAVIHVRKLHTTCVEQAFSITGTALMLHVLVVFRPQDAIHCTLSSCYCFRIIHCIRRDELRNGKCENSSACYYTWEGVGFQCRNTIRKNLQCCQCCFNRVMCRYNSNKIHWFDTDSNPTF